MRVAKDDERGGGQLVLLVGVSGAGKDTLFSLAQRQLLGCDCFVFQPLDITRSRHQENETHNPVGEAEYHNKLAGGFYALAWEANNHGYGLPRSIEHSLQAGKIVVAIGSRAVLPTALTSYPKLRVVLIEAKQAVVRQRLERRGRETLAETEQRLERPSVIPNTSIVLSVVNNDGRTGKAADKLVSILRTLAGF